MQALIVVNNPKDWAFQIPNVDVISARAYLTHPEYAKRRGAKVFNLCRSYRYQSLGYYVSLLAAARGHKPVPNVATIQELKSAEIVRIRSDDLERLIQQSFAPIVSSRFELSVYFGRNMAKRYDRLAAHLFKLFYSPLLRASFVKLRAGRWYLQSVSPISADEIPLSHHAFVQVVASEYFGHRRWSAPPRRVPRYDLAILYDSRAPEPPSDSRAIAKFTRAASALGIATYLIGKDDYARLAEFDALFIRETTSVSHHTYRFARRAQAEGLVVIDDPDSILRCTNKVYLKELLDRHRVPTPKTIVAHRDNISDIVAHLGLPCILKQPDGAFSQGVVKVDDLTECQRECERLLQKSELIIAQEFMPTPYDWRIGILAGEALWAARYFMAKDHWQIIQHGPGGRRYGRVEAVPLDLVPKPVVRAALRASELIGDGLYGVDIKVVGKRVVVVEVNDNPSIDSGLEDAILKESLYERVMAVFLHRMEARQRGGERD